MALTQRKVITIVCNNKKIICMVSLLDMVCKVNASCHKTKLNKMQPKRTAATKMGIKGVEQ